MKVRCSSQARDEHAMTRGQGPRAERLSGTNLLRKMQGLSLRGEF